jgi:hypothetical protein
MFFSLSECLSYWLGGCSSSFFGSWGTKKTIFDYFPLGKVIRFSRASLFSKACASKFKPLSARQPAGPS